MKSLKYVWFLMVALMLVATGCASVGPKFKTLKSLGAPEWAEKAGGAFGGERGKVIFGVGIASNISNTALLRTASDNRARNEIAKTMQVKSESLMKDYMASTVAGDPNAKSEEQDVKQVVKTVSSMVLSGAEIVDHWQHPDTGDMYALARLDFQQFTDGLEKSKELSAKVRDYIKQNADKLSGDLDKEVEKMKDEK